MDVLNGNHQSVDPLNHHTTDDHCLDDDHQRPQSPPHPELSADTTDNSDCIDDRKDETSVTTTDASSVAPEDGQQMNKTLNFGKKRLFGRQKTTSAGDYKGSNGDIQAVNNGGAGGSMSSHTRKSQSSAVSSHKWPQIITSSSSNVLSSTASSHSISGNSNGMNGNNKATNGVNGGASEDRFLGEGIQFGAKLIGHEFVAEARGEHMCQQSLKKLKILQRGLGGHKRKIHLFISFDGIKIRDAQTSELIYHHSVPQISFISRDETDSRAFGYVFGSSSTGHQFIALKTQKEALPIMSAIGQLFTATLRRKRLESIGNSDGTSSHTMSALSGAINDDKTLRRESSVTLRPSRSESPNVPSMPAPPPPLHSNSSTGSATGAVTANDLDIFSSFEPTDNVFVSDYGISKARLEKMPGTSESTGGIDGDPFAQSFGSMSLSSNEWANFDDSPTSATGSPLQQKSHQHHSSGISANKPFVITLQNAGHFAPNAQQLSSSSSSSYNTSSSSTALQSLFNSSGHHNLNQLNNSSQMNNMSPMVNHSDTESIPSRPNSGIQTFNIPPPNPANQSLGSISSTSSTDRYACFAEIHSIGSSIFDSLVDQIAAETDVELKGQPSSPQKSLNNSSQNGSYGSASPYGGQQQHQHQHRLSSSSLNAGASGHTVHQNTNHNPNNHLYYSFDNPLNSEQQKNNFLFSQQQNHSSYQNHFNQNFGDYHRQNSPQSRNSGQFDSNSGHVNRNSGQFDPNSGQMNRNSGQYDQISGFPNRNSTNFDQNFGQMPPQNTNEFNAQNQWTANSFHTSQSTSSAVWSNQSSSSMSNSSQVSGTSSPAPPSVPAPTPPPTSAFGSGFDISRSSDRLNEMPAVFAELDPLGKDRPFVDKSQFFVERKQKPTLRDLNPDIPAVNPTFGTNSSPIYRPTNEQIYSNVTSVPPIPQRQPPYSSSAAANPFSASSSTISSISNDSNTCRQSPNPFNPFFDSTCALNASPTPPPPVPTPPPPPRPPSRDCPPVPPRNDLMSRSTPPHLLPKPPTPDLSAPPLPRRRTILPEHRYQSFDTTNRQSFDPFSTTNSFIPTNNIAYTDDSSAPPLPNPQRKVTPTSLVSSPSAPTQRPQPMARKLSKNDDPFNCAFIDSQLSSISATIKSSLGHNSSTSLPTTSGFGTAFSDSSVSTQSTPKSVSETVPNIRQQDLKLSEINSRYEWINETVDEVTPSTDCSRGFVADFTSVFSSPDSTADPFRPCKPSKLELNVRPNSEPPHVGARVSGFDDDMWTKPAVNHPNHQNSNNTSNECSSTAAPVGQDEVSPPERNIFIVKSDPFADDFFN